MKSPHLHFGRVVILALLSLVFSGFALAQIPGGAVKITLPGEPALFFAQGNYLLLRVRDGGLFRSADEGQTWEPAGDGLVTTTTLSLASVGDVLLAGTEAGLFRSDNQGKTWLRAGSFSGSLTSLAVSGASLLAIAPTGQGTGILRTDDFGQSWLDVSPTPQSASRSFLLLSAAGTEIITVSDAKVYYSTDKGQSWSVKGSVPDHQKLLAAGLNLYAVNGRAVLNSADLGQTWATFNSGCSISDIQGGNSTALIRAVCFGSPSAESYVFYVHYLGKAWIQVASGMNLWIGGPTGVQRAYLGGGRLFTVRRYVDFASSRVVEEQAISNIRVDSSIGVVSAASYGLTVSAEGIAAAFGKRLAEVVQAAATIPLPTSLGDVTVVVRDSKGTERLAPLFFVSPEQINFLVPQETAEGLAGFVIKAAGQPEKSGMLLVESVAPALFTAEMSGTGLAAALVVRVRADGTLNYEPVAVFDEAQKKYVASPISLGDATEQVWLALYGSGIRHRTDLNKVAVTIGNLAAQVSFAGPQGQYAGLDQINVLLPRALIGRGEVDVVLTVDGKAANTVRVAFK